MDYYSFGSNTRPSVTAKTADYDVPSFEEAFDTESLRRFFSCKDPLMTFQVQSHHKNPSMEEEIPSHTVELISPATTSHSTGILDIFSHHSEEMEHDVFSRTQSAHLNPSRNQVNHVNPAQKVPALIPQRTSVSENWGASNRTMHQTQQGPESGNLIAMLCQQIQGFYSEAPGQNNGGNLEAQLNGEAAGLVPKRKRSVWEDDDADPSVLKKIISKKGVFTVQKEAMSPNIQRKMSTQLGETQLKAKRKASAPALTAQMLDSGMGDFVLDGGQAVKEKETKPKKSSKKDKEKGEKAEKPEKAEKAEKPEKAEKAEKKSAQVNIQIGEMSGKKEKQGKSKKVVLGNLTIGMKNLGGQESKP